MSRIPSGLVMAFSVAMIMLVGTITAVREASHSKQLRDCEVLEQTSGIETKFVEYGYLSWDCMIKAKGNRWAKVTP